MSFSELVIATGNSHKVVEIRELLGISDLSIHSLFDLGMKLDIIEDGASFRENALKKVKEAVRMTGRVCVADDSGLEVDALGGRPGIYSSRFAHEEATDKENNRHLLDLLADIPWDERTARFRCVMALLTLEEEERFAEGCCEGIIDLEEKGEHGFGYDPLFFVPDYGKTLAELGPDIKNRISHRAGAAGELREILLSVIKR